MTDQERRVIKAIRAAMPAHERVVKFGRVCATSYVVARIAPKCLAVASPQVDWNLPKAFRCQGVNVHRFYGDFKAGDWVSMAYVVTPVSGEWIAVGWVE